MDDLEKDNNQFSHVNKKLVVNRSRLRGDNGRLKYDFDDGGLGIWCNGLVEGIDVDVDVGVDVFVVVLFISCMAAIVSVFRLFVMFAGSIQW